MRAVAVKLCWREYDKWWVSYVNICTKFSFFVSLQIFFLAKEGIPFDLSFIFDENICKLNQHAAVVFVCVEHVCKGEDSQL